jgi:hypothetical protein
VLLLLLLFLMKNLTYNYGDQLLQVIILFYVKFTGKDTRLDLFPLLVLWKQVGGRVDVDRPLFTSFIYTHRTQTCSFSIGAKLKLH